MHEALQEAPGDFLHVLLHFFTKARFWQTSGAVVVVAVVHELNISRA